MYNVLVLWATISCTGTGFKLLGMLQSFKKVAVTRQLTVVASPNIYNASDRPTSCDVLVMYCRSQHSHGALPHLITTVINLLQSVPEIRRFVRKPRLLWEVTLPTCASAAGTGSPPSLPHFPLSRSHINQLLVRLLFTWEMISLVII